MGKRSPVLGYNHNFKHRGLIFHVQTEDSGVDNPHLFTHLFHGGIIISSRRIDYDNASEEDTVKSLMQSQHKAVLKDLKRGTFDDKIDAYLGDRPNLLPRKSGETPGRAETVDPIPAEIATDVTQDVAEAAARAAAQHATLIEKERRSKSTPPPIPAGSRVRRHIPTPMSSKADGTPHDGDSLGQPMVTFESDAAPQAPRSGAYSMQNPDATIVSRRQRLRSTSRHPIPSAADIQQAPEAKSVVATRPAVIVGAPPKVVGKRRRASTVSTRTANLFGKNLISEKSLDEVIMAYLSEDSVDE